MTALLALEPSALKSRRYRFDTMGDTAGGRISVYQRPIPGHVYVCGSDFAYGLASGDSDTACVIDKTRHERTGIATQVCEVEGKYGERFDAVLYCLLMAYNGAFLLGERQVGLFTLRRLWDRFQYRNMYRQKSEARGSRTQEDNAELGWHRAANDLTLKEARRAVLDRTAEVRSPELLRQLSRLQWVNRTGSLDAGERDPDERLKVKLKGGRSPDLAIAWMYSLRALQEVYLFEQPEPAFKAGTYGEIFKLESKLPGVFTKQKQVRAGWVPEGWGG